MQYSYLNPTPTNGQCRRQRPPHYTLKLKRAIMSIGTNYNASVNTAVW